jgi:hypothetical protein
MAGTLVGNFNITGNGLIYVIPLTVNPSPAGFSQTGSLGAGPIIGFGTFTSGTTSSQALAYTPTVVALSTDGDSWTQTPTPPITINDLVVNQPMNNAAANTIAVVVGNNSNVAVNPNVANPASTWTQVALPTIPGVNVTAIASNPNPANTSQATYTAAGSSGNIVYFWRTTNPTPTSTSDWTQVSVDTGHPVTIQAAEYGADSFQFLTNNSVITSTDGTGWSETIIPNTTGVLQDIAYDTNANTFTITGSNNQIYQSNAMSNSRSYASAANIQPGLPANANIVSVSTQGGCTVATAVKEVAIGTVQSYLLKAIFGGIGGLIAGWAVSAVTSNTALSTSTCFGAKNILGTVTGTLFTSNAIPCSNTGQQTVATGGSTGTYISYGQNWKYHTFTSNGTFTVANVNPQYPYMDVLLVAGGGGVGNSSTYGGGGAGGVLYLPQENLATGTYTITIGNGAPALVDGGNSSITLDSGLRTVYATGGGHGGGGNGTNGGSGGGGSLGSSGNSSQPVANTTITLCNGNVYEVRNTSLFGYTQYSMTVPTAQAKITADLGTGWEPLDWEDLACVSEANLASLWTALDTNNIPYIRYNGDYSHAQYVSFMSYFPGGVPSYWAVFARYYTNFVIGGWYVDSSVLAKRKISGNATAGTGGLGISGQGYAGGNGSNVAGGGGGGAGGAGLSDGTAGPGISYSLTGSNVWYGNGAPGANAAGSWTPGTYGSGGNATSNGQPGVAIIRYRNETVVNTTATGGSISNVTIGNANYRVHQFSSSGTFSVANVSVANPICDVLIVGGGGQGGGGQDGGYRQGGGGGGQVIYQTGISLATGNYTVTVGAGGYGGQYAYPGLSGGNTSFSLVPGAVAIGGGAGAASSPFTASGYATVGASGGGGAWGYGNVNPYGANGIPGLGYKGGNGVLSQTYVGSAGGGGGGANGPGGDAFFNGPPYGGNGGWGYFNSITGSNVEYGGGGGGYAGGYNNNPVPGRSAGGPGGGGYVAGLDGTVIIRYQVC